MPRLPWKLSRSPGTVRQRGWLSALIVGVLLLASCADPISPTGGVVSVGFDAPPPTVLEVGSTFRLQPVPLGADGRVLDEICLAEFASSNPSVARVDG